MWPFARAPLKLPGEALDNGRADGLANLPDSNVLLSRRPRHRLAYANVVSSLALFIALGGASYAAFRLPPNSVGTQQIKNHAVTLIKIDTGVRRAMRQTPGLQGPAGPRGATGPEGPQGVPGTARAYGEVSATGVLSNSKGNGTVTHPQTGRYCLTVPDANPSNETIGVTLNLTSTPTTAPPTERPGDDTVCPVGTWEIATGTLRAPGGAGAVQFIDGDQPFGFIVP